MVEKRRERRTYEVLISHDGMNAGETFGADPEDFGRVQGRVDAGYLREIKREAGDGGRGEGGTG